MVTWPRRGPKRPPIIPDRRDPRWNKRGTMQDGCALYAGRPVALHLKWAQNRPPRIAGHIVAIHGTGEDARVSFRPLFGGSDVPVPVSQINKIEPVDPRSEKRPDAAPAAPKPKPEVPVITMPELPTGPHPQPPEPEFDYTRHGEPRKGLPDDVPRQPRTQAAWENMSLDDRVEAIRAQNPLVWPQMTEEEQWHWVCGPAITGGYRRDEPLPPTWEEWRKLWKTSYPIPSKTNWGKTRNPMRIHQSPWG